MEVTIAIGTVAIAKYCNRRRHAMVCAEDRTAASVSTSGPIHTGQVRNAAAPNSANQAIIAADGRLLQTTSVHHIATANSSLTTCDRNDCSMNEPAKNTYGSHGSSAATIANGMRIASSAISRRAIRDTAPVLTATVSATTGCATCIAFVCRHAAIITISRCAPGV